MMNMAAPQSAGLPASLAGKFKGSFAYNTIKDRLPLILTRVVDTLHRHKHEFFEEHGEKGIAAEKKAIASLSKLRNELQTDKPLIALSDNLPDTLLWNQYLEYHQSLTNEPPSWFQSPWLYTECYMYRRIYEALIQSPPINDYDAFKEEKDHSFFESQEAIIVLSTYLQELLKNIEGLDENCLKEEFCKLIQRTYNHLLLDIPDTREQLCHYRNASETARSDLAALLVKYECAQAENLDLKSRIASQEVSIHELKAEVGGYKENDARQSSLLSSMQHKFQELEKESGTIAISIHQAELKAQALLQENLELKGKIHEQEGQIRKYLKESEESKSHASKVSREQNEFIVQFCHLLDMDIRGNEESPEHLLSKISDMHKENNVLKEQAATLKETIMVHEMELKANRETIMRLVSEVSKEQKKTSSCSQDIEKLSDELSNITAAKQDLEKEKRNLQDSLTASQKAWEELSQLKIYCNEKEADLRASVEQTRVEKKLYNEFKDQIVTILGSNSFVASPSEKDVVEKIQELCHGEESRKTMASQLEAQICKLTETQEAQAGLHQEALQRAQKAEHKAEMLQDQLMRLEGELVSGDLIRDVLKLEKQKYLKFLDQLSEKMSLDNIADDIGFDMRLDAVLARVEQLIRSEGDTLIANKMMTRNLQRKLKAQKEQLENKELHMKLLRQKIVQLEEEKQARTALAVERDEAHLSLRKLQKQIDRLQNELSLARETSTDMKLKLADTNELKIRALEQNKTIEELSKSREKLQKMKTKAEKELASVKSELHVREREAKEDREKAKHLLDSVTTEVTALKSTLQEVMKREKQLADFRTVISCMLGLDITAIALPDYEIITRLEGLIHSHQHHCTPCACFKCQRGMVDHCSFSTEHP